MRRWASGTQTGLAAALRVGAGVRGFRGPSPRASRRTGHCPALVGDVATRGSRVAPDNSPARQPRPPCRRPHASLDRHADVRTPARPPHRRRTPARTAAPTPVRQLGPPCRRPHASSDRRRRRRTSDRHADARTPARPPSRASARARSGPLARQPVGFVFLSSAGGASSVVARGALRSVLSSSSASKGASSSATRSRSAPAGVCARSHVRSS